VALTGAMPDAAMLDHARRLLARVLDTPGGMRIETIHAFCQSLLRRFPIEADVAPHFEVMDERSAGEALAAAREEVLAAAQGGGELGDALGAMTRLVGESGFDDVMGQLTLERGRLRRALADGQARFTAALGRVLEVPPGLTEADVIAAACAAGAADEPALRRAADAMLAGCGVRDQERGRRIAQWLADPPARVVTFADYLCAFFTQDGKPFQDIVTKGLAAKRLGAFEAL